VKLSQAEIETDLKARIAVLEETIRRYGNIKVAATLMLYEYWTSDSHHPQHIVVNRSDFEALGAALAEAKEATP
jgi:hypothetical protein